MNTYNQVELLALLDDFRHITLTSMLVNGSKHFDIYITVLRRGKLISIPFHKLKDKDVEVLDTEATNKLLTKVDKVVSTKVYVEYKKEFQNEFNELLLSYEEEYTKELRNLLEETKKVMLVLRGLVRGFQVMHGNLFYDEFEKGKLLLDESYVYYLENWSYNFTRYEIGAHYVSTRLPVTRYLNEESIVNYKELVLKGIEDDLVIQISFVKDLKLELLKSVQKAFKLNLDLYMIYKSTGRIKKVKDLYALLDNRCGRELREMLLRLEELEGIYIGDATLEEMKQAYKKVLAADYGYVYINRFN